MKFAPTELKWIVVALAFALALAGGVSAQEGAAPADPEAESGSESTSDENGEDMVVAGRGEIVVLAQRREQPLQDIGIAITALTADELYETGVRYTEEIIQLVPGLMQQQTRGSWIIRGVGTQSVGTGNEAATSVYVDDSYLYWAQATSQQLFDMAQTEVMKGPQGTLFGRNATGGLIHFRTAEPNREAGGFVDLTIGDFNHARAEAAYGGALGSKVSGRIAALVNTEDNSYTRRFPESADHFREDSWAVRGKLRWDPSDRWSVLFSGSHSEQDTPRNPLRTHFVSRFGPDGLGYLVDDPDATDVFGWRNPEGSGVFDTWVDAEPRGIINVSGGSMTADWVGNGLEFRSITSVMYGNSNVVEDGDQGPLDVVTLNSPGPGLPNNTTRSFTQEFNLSGGNRLRWIVGAFYLTIDQEGLSNFSWGDAFGGFTDWEREENAVDSLSGYGQIQYDLSKKWRLVAGLRYTDESRRARGESLTELSDGTIEPGDTRDQERKMDKPLSGKVALEFFPGDNIMAYASVNQGTKSGGFNSVALPPEFREFADERLTAFELGTKLSLGPATSLNAAAFYYDYSGYQLRNFNQELIEVFINNNDAEIIGGEIELFSQPAPNLDLAFGLSLLDAKVFDLYREVGGEVFYFPERVMQQAPPFTFNGAVTWRLPLGSSGRGLDLHTNFNWVDTQQYTAYNDPSIEQEPYLYAYASVTYHPRNRNWQAFVWVKNLFNEEYRRGGDDVSLFGFSTAPMNPARRFGLTFRVNVGL